MDLYMREYKTLDEFIEMYLYNSTLRGNKEQLDRADDLLKQREIALGITGDALDELLDLIDEYAKDENAYDKVTEYYDRITA